MVFQERKKICVWCGGKQRLGCSVTELAPRLTGLTQAFNAFTCRTTSSFTQHTLWNTFSVHGTVVGMRQCGSNKGTTHHLGV